MGQLHLPHPMHCSVDNRSVVTFLKYLCFSILISSFISKTVMPGNSFRLNSVSADNKNVNIVTESLFETANKCDENIAENLQGVTNVTNDPGYFVLLKKAAAVNFTSAAMFQTLHR